MSSTSTSPTYRFSFGPWNISEGADPFGPATRATFDHGSKFALYRSLGFEGVQFHDDDVVPDLEELSADQVLRKAEAVGAMLCNEGLTPEFVAPRLWLAPETVDGGYTSNSEPDRQYALDRTLRTTDIARAVGCEATVLWLAREGSEVHPRPGERPRPAHRICADTGHWATSGLNPVECLKTLEGRVINLHIKDRTEIGKETTDRVSGKGILDVPGMLAELKRQKFRGCLFIEYETNRDNSVPDVRECVEFVLKTIASLK